MIRETRARLLAASTAVLLVGLAAVFSLLSNPPASNAPVPAAQAPPPDLGVEPGRRVYDRLGCARCHSIAGQGNPGAPLDGVGGRLDPAMLRAWTLGGEAAVRAGLPPSLAKRKAAYASDPNIAALVAYLQSLRAANSQQPKPK